MRNRIQWAEMIVGSGNVEFQAPQYPLEENQQRNKWSKQANDTRIPSLLPNILDPNKQRSTT
jgi:hypothetical protein